MPTLTYVYTAKAALIDRLIAYAATGQPLAGLQVAYAYPGDDVDLECLYGGGVRFAHTDMVAEAPGVMVSEDAIVSLFIRVARLRPPVDVRETDARAAAIAAQVAALLRDEPKLAGGSAVLGIARGSGDYGQSVDETSSVLLLQVRVASSFAYG